MEWDFFPEEELKCKCGCGECDMDEDFMKRLIEARKIADIPFVITSGYRCAHHDSMVSGAGNHSQGKAVDIKCIRNYNDKRFKIIDALLKAGFVRIGIAQDFIHVDSCTDKTQKLMWLYSE